MVEDNKELIGALVKFQGGITAIPRNRVNPFFKSKYASLDDIWDAIRPSMGANGLAVVQTTAVVDGMPCLLTTLYHMSGGSLQGILPLGVGREPTPQAMGSAITYARRYALAAILGLTPDDDDDAEGAEPRNDKREARSAPQRKEHWCAEHNRDFFKTAKMQAYAHPNDDGTWHNEQESPQSAPEGQVGASAPKPIQSGIPQPRTPLDEARDMDNAFSLTVAPPGKYTVANNVGAIQAPPHDTGQAPRTFDSTLAFLNAAMKELGLTQAQILTTLGIEKGADLYGHDLSAEWQKLVKIKGVE